MWSSRSRVVPLLFVSAAFHATSTSAAVMGATDAYHLFARDLSTCGGQTNFIGCGQGLPSNFCCPSSTNCIALNNTGTAAALCCPSGSNCNSVQPVSCDLTLQDPTKHPESSLKLDNSTGVVLKSCGNSLCCPLGYDCQNSVCNIQADTKSAPTSSTFVPSTSAPPVSASTLSTTATSTNTAAASPVSITPTQMPNKFPAGAVLAGFFPGILLGLLLALGLFLFLKRRKQGKLGKEHALFGGPAPRPKISEPRYQPGMTDRSDFMHARSASGSSIPQDQLPTPQQSGLGFGGYFKPSQRPVTGSTGTLVSPEQQKKNGQSLGTPFATPTRAAKPVQGARVRALFSKSPSQRSKTGSRKSRRTLGQSSASQETIDVLMGGQPDFGLPPSTIKPFTYQGDGKRPKTPPTFADVYRAAGVSPPKSEAPTPGARPTADNTRF